MKRFAAGIIAGFLLLQQPVLAQPSGANAQPSSDSAIRETLANGMRVVLLPNKLAPVATTVITYGVGSDDDTLPGIAHATEHMMFRGTKDLSASQFSAMAARAGADYNAATSNTFTNYYFKVPSAYTPLALRLEADRMTGALDRESDWTNERGAIVQEVRAHESVPGASVIAKMRHAFFGDSPYAEDAVGTVAGFEKMRAADIAAFYHAWYHPNNATLVVAGDIDPQATLAQIHEYFDPIPKGDLPAHETVAVNSLTAQTLRDSIDELPVPVSAVSFRFPALDSPDYAAGQVLSEALNNGRSGFADLQAKGQVLAAFSVAGAYPEVGMLMVAGIGLPGAQPETAHALIAGVVDGYRTSGVPPELFEAAKARLLSEQDYRESSISGLAFRWAGSLAEGDASPDAVYDAIAKVTSDDVNRVLRDYIGTKQQIAMLLTPKSTSVVPHVDPNAGVENVKVDASKDEPLPAWATAYFEAPLRAPQSDSEVQTFRLRNGIRLTVRHESLAPTVVINGSILMSADLYEPRGLDGVAEITSSLLPWGTKTYDRKALEAQLDAITATASLGSSFSLTAQAKNFDRGMQLLADGLLHPAFAPQPFQVVKSTTAQTLGAMQRQPRTQAALAETDALYPPGDPRRRHATQQTVEAIGLADVKRWYAFAYRPDLTTISVVGDVTPAHAREVVERYFGAWHASGKVPSFRYPTLKSSKSESVTVTSPSNRQSQVTLTQIIGVHRGDSDYIALQLANTVLSGEGTASMLFHDVRENKGYVYEISSSMDIGRTNSTFSIDFASDPKNVRRAQAAAVTDLKRLQTALLPDVELQRAKALLLAQRVLPLDSYEGISQDILETAESGLTPRENDAFWQSLIRTTPQQVRDAMRRWVHPDRFLRVEVAPSST